jgi:hypothetical protein
MFAGKVRAHPQTFVFAGKVCQGQTLQLITNINELRRGKVLKEWAQPELAKLRVKIQ